MRAGVGRGRNGRQSQGGKSRVRQAHLRIGAGPIKGKPIIPIEDDGKPSPNAYVIVNLNVCNAHGGHCGE